MRIHTGSTGNKAFWAKWTATLYDIAYHQNGGTGATNGTYTIESAAVALPAAMTRTGYLFAGWYGNAAFTGDTIMSIPAGSTGNRAFWAKWTQSTGIIRVQITDMSGNAIPGDTVYIHRIDSVLREIDNGIAAADGRYVSELLPVGNYVVAAAAGSRFFTTYSPSALNWKDADTIRLAYHGQDTAIVIRLQAVPVAEEGSITIEGYVREEDAIATSSLKARVARNSVIRVYSNVGSKAVKSVKTTKSAIDEEEWKLIRTVSPDESGYYVVKNLPKGVYMVVVDIPGYEMEGIVIEAEKAEDEKVFTLYDLVINEATHTIDPETLKFEDYVLIKWGNSFILNLKKLEGDRNFEVTDCRWYKNGNSIETGLNYAEATTRNALTEGAKYRFVVSTTVGDLQSTDYEHHHKTSVVTSTKAYPNPATSGTPVYVELDASDSGSLIEVYNATGKLVSKTKAEGNPVTLNLSVPPGVYFIRINGKTEKIIVN
jgi:uncharacterized repeat protein (TIGR02543 family)